MLSPDVPQVVILCASILLLVEDSPSTPDPPGRLPRLRLPVLAGFSHDSTDVRRSRLISLRQNGVVLPIGMARMWPCQNTVSKRMIALRMASRTLAPRDMS